MTSPQATADRDGVFNRFCNWFAAQEKNGEKTAFKNDNNLTPNEDTTAEDYQQALDYLTVRFYGQPITSNFRTLCATALSNEMASSGVTNNSRKVKILRAIEDYISIKLTSESTYTYSQVEQIKRFNRGVKGVATSRNPWWYWDICRNSIDDDLNQLSPLDADMSFKISHLAIPIGMIAGVGLAAWFGKKMIDYYTTTPSLPLANTITIQNPQPPQLQPSSSGINLSELTLTTLRTLNNSINTLNASLSTLLSTQEENTSILSKIQQNTNYTPMFSRILNAVKGSATASLPSQK